MFLQSCVRTCFVYKGFPLLLVSPPALLTAPHFPLWVLRYRENFTSISLALRGVLSFESLPAAFVRSPSSLDVLYSTPYYGYSLKPPNPPDRRPFQPAASFVNESALVAKFVQLAPRRAAQLKMTQPLQPPSSLSHSYIYFALFPKRQNCIPKPRSFWPAHQIPSLTTPSSNFHSWNSSYAVYVCK